ncbi:hypothetical protein NDN08_007832 [Rhodosorus marinus]|uniref:Opine dehydrogenase domain-containing protein n=1 Tax=Rhodosorus marinus TaxID=101924 RepID=A0AAV8V1H3_9RHOD|nr:hypothetical protein NDN08_007832 [Rhodosorus marinus]
MAQKKSISWEALCEAGDLGDDYELDLSTTNVTVCGGGNAAHVGAAMFAKQGCKTNMYLSLPKEAEKMKAGIAEGGIECQQTADDNHMTYVGSPLVSADPSITKDSDVVVILAPAFAHESICRETKPFLKKGAIIGTLPAHGGFDLVARHALDEKIDEVVVFGTVGLPWTTRIIEYGKKVEVYSTKANLRMNFHPRVPKVPALTLLSTMFIGTTFQMGNDYLECTLWPVNNVIHPGILYGRWKDWDGIPVAEKPLFYNGVDDFTASKLEGMSDEIQATAKAAQKELGVELAVPSLKEFLENSYGDLIPDRTSLKTIFRTSPAYQGLTHPMTESESGFSPDFKNRYLTEDLPHGLAVVRGIAALVEVPTPCIDEVLTWAQNACGQSYLVDGKMTGNDISHSGVPQRFGFEEISELIF